ncbi:transposable element Tcb2 transposase [Trichonephila clavipes]|nr:transposable element Tcb2 transposase [Trichonephila clavipes]
MSERGETDLRSIGISDKFRATAVRRNVVNLQTRDDNAPCHRAVLIDDFLETENIQRMSWPANSPDLSPDEHVRDMLGR